MNGPSNKTDYPVSDKNNCHNDICGIFSWTTGIKALYCEIGCFGEERGFNTCIY